MSGDEAVILRIVLFLALLGVLVFLFRKRWRALRSVRFTKPERPELRPSVPMRVCAHCGIHLPEPDAIRDGDRYYCCSEHRKAGPAE